MTNVADALSLDPDLGSKLNSVTIIGGSPTAFGNAGIVSEFNFDFDPEAAKYSLEHLPQSRLISWDIGFETQRPWQWWQGVLRNQTSEMAMDKANCGVEDDVSLSALTMKINDYPIHQWPTTGVLMCDPVTMFA